MLQKICILLQMYCNVLEYWQLWFIPPWIPESPQASVSHSGILYTFPSSITISSASLTGWPNFQASLRLRAGAVSNDLRTTPAALARQWFFSRTEKVPRFGGRRCVAVWPCVCLSVFLSVRFYLSFFCGLTSNISSSSNNCIIVAKYLDK